MDGLKNRIRQSPVPIIQSAFYNGWKCEHWIVNLFVFSPDGKLVMAGLNMPGSYHDSKVARDLGIYDTLKELYIETGANTTVVDSAFCLPQAIDMFYKSGQSSLSGNAQTDVCFQAVNTSFRQRSEWGMRAVQGTFPRIKDYFDYEEKGERGRILLSIVLIYNLRTSRMGQNQLRSDRDVEDLLPPGVRNECVRRNEVEAERRRLAEERLQRSFERRAVIQQRRASRRRI